MKHFIILIILLTSLKVFGQKDTIPKVNGTYQYQEIVNLDTTFKKDYLYKNTKLFFVQAYKSSKDVVQYDEKDQIIGKGFFRVKEYQALAQWTWDIYFTTQINIKDGKYKYRLFDIRIEQAAGTGAYERDAILDIDQALAQTTKAGYKKVTKKLYSDMIAGFKDYIKTLKSKMAQKDTASDKDF